MNLHFQRKQLSIPYVIFLLCFVIAPVLVVFYYAFTNGEGRFTAANFIGFFTNQNTIGTLCYSLVVALTVTICCTLVAYPTAYILARSHFKKKAVLLVLFVAPMWINFTLRVVALKEVLTMIEGNLAYHPFLNTVLGMTYDFLPFMILPLYTTLSKLDKSYLEAAADLGASPVVTFMKVTFPLSMPGLISGITMVFLPSMTNYVILDMLYNSTYIMGSLIGSYFSAYDWHSGSMISIVLLAIIFLITWATNGFNEEETSRGEYYDQENLTLFMAGTGSVIYISACADAGSLQLYRYGNNWYKGQFFPAKLRDTIHHTGTKRHDWWYIPAGFRICPGGNNSWNYRRNWCFLL